MRVLVATILALLLLGSCASVPGADGRYATPGRGGWDGFRAATPMEPDQLALGQRPLTGSRLRDQTRLHRSGRLPPSHGATAFLSLPKTLSTR